MVGVCKWKDVPACFKCFRAPLLGCPRMQRCTLPSRSFTNAGFANSAPKGSKIVTLQLVGGGARKDSWSAARGQVILLGRGPVHSAAAQMKQVVRAVRAQGAGATGSLVPNQCLKPNSDQGRQSGAEGEGAGMRLWQQ